MFIMLAILFIIFMEIIGATNQNNDFDKFLALARKTRYAVKFIMFNFFVFISYYKI